MRLISSELCWIKFYVMIILKHLDNRCSQFILLVVNRAITTADPTLSFLFQIDFMCLWITNRVPRYPLNDRLGGTQIRSGRCEEEKNILPLPIIESRYLGSRRSTH
jgi:hypothetical protein